MSNHPFQQFLELVSFDQAVHGLLQTKESLARDIIHIEQRIQEQDILYAQSQRLVTEARKAVDACELEMKTLEHKAQELKRKIDHVSNYKESASLHKELEHIGAQQHELEDELLRAWNKLETNEREKNEQLKQCEEKKQQAQDELVKKRLEQEEVIHALKAHESGRDEKKEGIPDEWLQKYESMRLLATDPIVPVERDSCSACFHELSKQEMTRLLRGALLECKACFRFLYHQKSMQGE